MKLEIEKWVETTGIFESVAKNTFDEAVLCYKVGAYKSAFIMSYLSFKLTVKQRIIQFDNNSVQSFEIGRWDNIIKELNDDDKWEDRLNKEILCKDSSAIIKFTNRESTIVDYNYWKNMRNSCAHAKGQIIDASTVGSFWNYLKDNLSKFYVLGGKEYITKEFLDYFRYFKVHKKDEYLDRILNDISILYSNDTEKFFRETITNFKTENIDIINTYNSDIWKHILCFKNIDIKNGFLKFVGKDNDLLIEFYSFFPNILIYIIQLDEKFIVDRLNIFLKYVASDYNYNKYFLEILCQIIYFLNNDKEIDEILENCKDGFQNGQIQSMIENLQNDQLRLLKEKDVFKKIIDISYTWIYKLDSTSQYEQFDKWKYKTDEVISLFKYVKFDIHLLQKLNDKISYLSNCVHDRKNLNSKENGYNACKMFEEIVKNNKEEIEKISDNSKDEFHTIRNILKNIPRV